MAWASIETPACCRICERVKLVISLAMSVSRMRDSEAARFSAETPRLAMVCCRRFCNAPRSARWLDTEKIALSMLDSAAAAPDWLDRLMGAGVRSLYCLGFAVVKPTDLCLGSENHSINE